MSGCVAYKVLRSENFETTLVETLKTHYSTNPESRRDFEELIAVYWTELHTRPRDIIGASPEPWPPGKKNSKNGFDFYKIRFFMPGLSGNAKMGRLMYIVHENTCTVRVVWVYTHDEFHGRPYEENLRDELRRCTEIVIDELIERPLKLTLPFGKTLEISLSKKER